MRKIYSFLLALCLLPLTMVAENQGFTKAARTSSSDRNDSRAYIQPDIIRTPDGQPITSHTVATWFKINKYSDARGASNNMVVMGFGGREHCNDNGAWNFCINSNGVPTILGWGGFSGTPSADPISVNEWHHVVASYNADNMTMSFYLDGQLFFSKQYEGTNNGFNWFTNENPAFYFGAYCFNGMIDEVQVWNKALSADEVTAANAAATSVNGLVGLYTFDETPAVDGTFPNQSTQSGASAEPCYYETLQGQQAWENGVVYVISAGSYNNVNPTLEVSDREVSVPEVEVTPAGDAVNYAGNLQIVIGEAVLPSEATVSVTPMSDGSYRLVLPDFSLDLGEGPQSLGDIVVDNVQITEDGGNKTYAGSVNNFTLANGEIRTNITLTGTEDANGAIQLTIQVDWLDVETGEVLMPIMVYFNGQKEGTEPPAEVEYCIPVRDVTGATTVSRNDRYVSKITFNDGVNTLEVAGNGWSSGRDVFCDHTDQTFVTNPGAAVNVKTTAGGEWMNYFVYIDFDKNGFTYDDLVFTNFTGNHVNIATEFVVNIPAEVAYGEYRMRVMLDWKNEDPCIYGVDQGSDNGECCVDLMIRLKSDNHDAPRTITVSANDDAYGTVAITDPATEGNTVSTDQKSVTMVATAADGYTFANWTDAAGNVVSEDATYTYSGAADASFTANFGVTFSYFVGEGGTAAFMVEGEAIASDVILLPGTEVTVNVTPNTGMQANIIVNGMAVDFTNNTYTFTIDRASSVVVSFVDAVYTLTIEVIGDGEVKVTDGGTMAVGPQGNEYKTGDNITGKALRIFMKPAEGAELVSASFVDEGSESKTLTTREVTAADYQGWYYTASAQPTGNRVLTVEFTSAQTEVEYCQPTGVEGRYYPNNKTAKADRVVNSINFTDGTNSVTVEGAPAPVGMTGTRAIVYDRTSTVLTTTAGSTINATVDGEGVWMNTFVYVDFDLNGFTVADKVFDNFDGACQEVGTSFSFNVPATAQPAEYRVRYILDWENTDPCYYGQAQAGTSINDNGEYVIDFVVKVVDNTQGIGEIGIDPANGPVEYYNLQGVRVAAENLVPGFYVVRQGEKVAKVFINK